jgi:hypothetical protein
MEQELTIKRFELWLYMAAIALCAVFLITGNFGTLYFVWFGIMYVQFTSVFVHLLASRKFRFQPARIFLFVSALLVIGWLSVHAWYHSSMREALFMLCFLGLWQVQYTILTGLEVNELRFDEKIKPAA